jgi:hypothetical protein
MFGQVTSGYVRLGQVILDYFMLVQVRSSLVRLGQFCSG